MERVAESGGPSYQNTKRFT